MASNHTQISLTTGLFGCIKSAGEPILRRRVQGPAEMDEKLPVYTPLPTHNMAVRRFPC